MPSPGGPARARGHRGPTAGSRRWYNGGPVRWRLHLQGTATLYSTGLPAGDGSSTTRQTVDPWAARAVHLALPRERVVGSRSLECVPGAVGLDPNPCRRGRLPTNARVLSRNTPYYFVSMPVPYSPTTVSWLSASRRQRHLGGGRLVASTCHRGQRSSPAPASAPAGGAARLPTCSVDAGDRTRVRERPLAPLGPSGHACGRASTPTLAATRHDHDHARDPLDRRERRPVGGVDRPRSAHSPGSSTFDSGDGQLHKARGNV